MPRSPNETKPRQFRLEQPTLDDLDAIAEYLTRERGYRHTRSDAVRLAVRELAKKIEKKEN